LFQFEVGDDHLLQDPGHAFVFSVRNGVQRFLDMGREAVPDGEPVISVREAGCDATRAFEAWLSRHSSDPEMSKQSFEAADEQVPDARLEDDHRGDFGRQGLPGLE
jgi:hypothetical protein